jgi:hypothetical protein
MKGPIARALFTSTGHLTGKTGKPSRDVSTTTTFASSRPRSIGRSTLCYRRLTSTRLTRARFGKRRGINIAPRFLVAVLFYTIVYIVLLTR